MTDDRIEEVIPTTKRDSLLKRYWTAVWTVGATFLATILISPFVPPDLSSLFLIAVMVSAWRGGLPVGLFATLLSVLIDVFIFLPPTASFSLDNGDFVQLIVDVFAAIVVGTLSASRSKAESERQKLLLLERSARIESERAHEVKDEFLAAVSHELRTPLTTIKTLTRLLLKKAMPGEKSHRYLLDIASECDRQIDLVHNLLDLSRIKAGGVEIELGQVDVEEVLHSCEKIEHVGASERGHRILIDAAPDLFVRADGGALRRVICTIIENAVKYTPDNGLITLRAYPESPGGSVLIEISDNGRGISENDLPHIFESFYRGRSSSGSKSSDSEKETVNEEALSGIGLGLYLARSLVEAMNGQINVVSRIRDGSTFTIRLPVWQQEILSDESAVSEKIVERMGEIQSL